MKVVTLITDRNNTGYKNLLKPSLVANNLNITVLQSDHYKNHREKDALLLEYLNNLTYDDVIFFTDGYDTTFLANEDEILAKYLTFGKELIFAAEMVCWPDSDHIEKYPKTHSSFKFLNSGGFIGKAGYIKERIRENLKTKSTTKYAWSNQVYWTEQYLLNQNEIAIDNDCKIFCTMVSAEDEFIGNNYLTSIANLETVANLHNKDKHKNENFDKEEYLFLKKKWFNEKFIIENNRLFVVETQSYPCHIHFNGESKILIPVLLEELLGNVT